MKRPAAAVMVGLSILVGCPLAGCGATAGLARGGLRVVAAEDVWGSLAAQLAGAKAGVQSIITSPAQDPHSYEPTAADARTLATAQLVIVNGIGYDPWVSKLLAASPAPGRVTLNVGELLHLREGENPHRWYSPDDVERVAAAIAASLARLDRRNAGYFERRQAIFANRGLAAYHNAIAQIRRRFAGTPVGASESIFALQAPALGLDLRTPTGFMKAISEGTEVTAADLLRAQRQIAGRQIKVWIYNSQNTTPQVARLNQLARAAHIPIVSITETLSPPSASFQQWQLAQLRRIAAALRAARGG